MDPAVGFRIFIVFAFNFVAFDARNPSVCYSYINKIVFTISYLFTLNIYIIVFLQGFNSQEVEATPSHSKYSGKMFIETLGREKSSNISSVDNQSKNKKKKN